ncbi:hypothetical protein [Rhizobium leguminosarum]|uniref:hypothetical protein n=1 Tax=Rhizobium leguminosarum TaxID=384 RepID=UPI001FEFFDEB|nr:hypothetical protein [Rhizobium leguminosarum]
MQKGVQLYNFPLCSVPVRYRVLAAASISDWKNKQEHTSPSYNEPSPPPPPRHTAPTYSPPAL